MKSKSRRTKAATTNLTDEFSLCLLRNPSACIEHRKQSVPFGKLISLITSTIDKNTKDYKHTSILIPGSAQNGLGCQCFEKKIFFGFMFCVECGFDLLK